MENGMETNYFTTTEPQDSGTEFLLPLLLCWKIITDVRAHRKQLPVEHGKTQGHSCTVSNLLLRNPKAIQNNLSSYFHCVPNWQGYQLSLHCASPWTSQNTFFLELSETMTYTYARSALQHMTVTGLALGSDLPPLRPLSCSLFLSSLSPAFPHTLLSLPTGSLHPEGLQRSWKPGSRV